jgi:hypothetical protein
MAYVIWDMAYEIPIRKPTKAEEQRRKDKERAQALMADVRHVLPFHKMMTNTPPFYRDRFC